MTHGSLPSGATATDALVVEQLNKRYPGVRALSAVSFAVRAGQVHALLGENGAGKSTLIRLLSGVETPDSGGIQFHGLQFRPSSPLDALRTGLSTLYQEQNLLPDRPVMHNVLLGDEPRRMRLFVDRRAMQATARAALDQVGATHIAVMDSVSGLSVADRQLVDIARALHRNSRLLIMDEPTAALSAREVDALFKVVTSLPGRGVTVLFVSHRMEEIFRIADAVTVLRDGRHVRTAPIDASLTADDLINDMVGEHMLTVVPPRSASPDTPPNFIVDRLRGPGFRNVSFTVSPGRIVAITGVTGSGKEQLGLTLFGAIPATGGVMRLDNRPVRLTPRSAIRRGIVGVPADRARDGIIGALPVRRNLSLPSLRRLTHAGLVSRTEERRLADRQISELAIKARSRDTPVGQLSGGNQQKVSLGKWLDRPPRVLVLMEPTQGIDIKARYDFYRLLRRLAEQGTAVIVVTSDIPEVLTLADHILIMRGSKIVGELDHGSADAETVIRLSFGEASRAGPAAVNDA